MPNHLDEIKQRSLAIARECDRQIRAINEEIAVARQAVTEEDDPPTLDDMRLDSIEATIAFDTPRPTAWDLLLSEDGP